MYRLSSLPQRWPCLIPLLQINSRQTALQGLYHSNCTQVPMQVKPFTALFDNMQTLKFTCNSQLTINNNFLFWAGYYMEILSFSPLSVIIIIAITSSGPWRTETHRMDWNPTITNHKPWTFELIEVKFCFLRGLISWLMTVKANVSLLLIFWVRISSKSMVTFKQNFSVHPCLALLAKKKSILRPLLPAVAMWCKRLWLWEG